MKIGIALIATAVVLLPGCASPRAQKVQIPVQAQVIDAAVRFRKEYVFAAGDQMEVAVRGVPEASHVAVIRPDGYISLPLIQDVKAAGLTPTELRDNLTQLFSTRLVKPEVSVLPTVVRQPMVYVVGEVARPMAVPYRDAPTAMQAISLVGGLQRTAANRSISIIRLGTDGYLRAINIDATEKGQPGPVMALRTATLLPDDIVFVPENGKTQVSRFYDEIIARPLQAVNLILGTYLNFRLVETISRH